MSFVHRCRPSHHHPLNLRTRDHHLPPTPHRSCPSPPIVSGPPIWPSNTLLSTCPRLGIRNTEGNQSPCLWKLCLGEEGLWEGMQMVAVLCDRPELRESP